jgi:hypothetical protein
LSARRGIEDDGVGGGEEGAEAPLIEQGVLACGFVVSALKSAIRHTSSRTGTWAVFFCAANAVLAISAREIHFEVPPSKVAAGLLRGR